MTMDQAGYIIDLGLIDYQKAWDLQHQLWLNRVKDEIPDIILILEHPHVITLGRRGNRSHLLVSEEYLEKIGISIFHVERGGDITYHGPGQIIAYPILNLRKYEYNLLRYIDQLEEVIIRVLKDFGIEGRKDSLNRGVWVKEEKIASLGLAIKYWVSYHGLALNYQTDLKYFDLIHPCGLEGKRMTSMAKLLGREISKEELIERISFYFEEVFEKEWQKRKLEEVLCPNPLG